MIVPILFFCSGATALVYQVVWSKYLSLMLGSTVQAQTTVLAVFMGGLALGNRLFGRRADRMRSPLEVYGRLEVAIGLYSFFFDHWDRWADRLFQAVGHGRLDQPWLLLGMKAVLSLGLLLGPTVLMGGTLPLLASWLHRQYADGGRWSARFYGINSLGAVAGAAVAGFFLVQTYGLVSTLQMTALANVLIGVAAVGVARGKVEMGKAESRNGGGAIGEAGEAGEAAETEGTVGGSMERAGGAWVSGCWIVAMSGGISMGLEVLGARSLILIFGGSLQAFSIVLMAFILGIGLGSSLIASPRWHRIPREAATAGLLLGAAVWIGVLVMGIDGWVKLYLLAKTGLASSSVGFYYYQGLTAAMAMVVLGVPAGLLGAVLPLWIRGGEEKDVALAERVGRLLTWNTLGAVTGTLLTGFFVMPVVGLRGAFFVLVGAMCAGAALVAWRAGRRVVTGLAVGIGVVLMVGATVTGEGWRQVLSSGVFRVRDTVYSPTVMDKRKKEVEILFYADAADATVSVEKVKRAEGGFDLGLRINGKADASSRVDLSTQYLLAHVPMLARPDAGEAFVLGLGSGVTAGALLGHPVQRVTIAENCEPVIRAAAFFSEWNRGVLTNSRAVIRREDARTVLKLSPQRYDILISEPSNPWTAGIGSVFSREFYELAASRLTEGGVMAQWFHVYEMSDEIVAMVLRTFGSVFQYMEIWDPGRGDIILLGSRKPWPSSPGVYRRVMERAGPRDDLGRLGIQTEEEIWARQAASQATARAISDRGPMQSDFFPVLEYEAPRAFYLGSSSQLLSVFDERTWQSEFASSEKRRALRGLSTASVKRVFGEFSSVSVALQRFLLRLVDPARRDEYSGRRLMPCVFRPEVGAAAPVLAGTEEDEAFRELWELELRMRSDVSSVAGDGRRLLEVLRTLKAGPDEGWVRKASDFALVAGRTAWGGGEVELARALITRGLGIEPGSPELRYAARLTGVLREGGVQGAEATTR